jgi:hypothetical protein
MLSAAGHRPQVTIPAAIPFRVRMTPLPAADFGSMRRIEAGLQRGKEVAGSKPMTGDLLEFTGELRLKSPQSRDVRPIFLGPFAHGPPLGRFIYIVWTGEENGVRRMFRRMKLQLGGIGWAYVDQVLQDHRAAIVATVCGTDRHGGPACATVPLLGGGWRVAP